MQRLVDIRWCNYGESIPAFLTIVLMPLTYSVSHSPPAFCTFVCKPGKMRAASMWAWQCTDACVHVQIAYGIFAGLLSFIVINMGSAIIGLPSQSCAKQGDRDRSKGWMTRGKERTKKSLLRAETVTAWGCDDHFVLICTQRQIPCRVRNTRCGTSGRTTTTAAIPGASGVLLSKRRLKCAPLRR